MMATDFGHTKGPWKWAGRNGGWDGVDAVGGENICHLEFNNPENARLIAAALICLRSILATAESNASGNPEWESVSAKINAARAAIAKATGK